MLKEAKLVLYFNTKFLASPRAGTGTKKHKKKRREKTLTQSMEKNIKY